MPKNQAIRLLATKPKNDCLSNRVGMGTAHPEAACPNSMADRVTRFSEGDAYSFL